MRDGCGDSYFILFTDKGAIITGFAHDSDVWQSVSRRGSLSPGILDSVPEEFERLLAEPASSMDEATFCLWRRRSDPAGRAGVIGPLPGDDPDGSAGLLYLLDGEPGRSRSRAEDYFETPVPRRAVDRIYGHDPIDEEVIKALTPELGLDDLADDLSEIAYPSR